MDKFEKEVLSKIDSGESLTEDELSELAYEYEVERKEWSEGRWTRSITSFIQLGDRYFGVDWGKALTECQEDEFYNQPYKLEKKTSEKIIPEHKEIVTEWASVE